METMETVEVSVSYERPLCSAISTTLIMKKKVKTENPWKIVIVVEVSLAENHIAAPLRKFDQF